jgi:ATP-dependent exoDNAse (exonuclease V) beta subunit
MTGHGDADEGDREKSGGESRFVRGTVVHRMLELLGTCAMDELETLLRREFPGFMASDGAVDDLRCAAERFAKSATGARGASAQGVQREAAFVLKIDDAYISGVIDMLLPDGTIVDYKTGKFHENLFAQYELQLRLYAIAARDVAGIQPRSAWLYYADSGVEIEVGVTEPLLEATMEKARQAVRMLKTGVGETT